MNDEEHFINYPPIDESPAEHHEEHHEELIEEPIEEPLQEESLEGSIDEPQIFTHLDPDGYARMVGVGHKPDMHRHAEAMGFIRLAPETLQALRDHTIPKGDVLTVARIAGIQAAKRTSDLIPLAHPLPLHGIEVEFAIEGQGIRIIAAVDTTGKTGVEMEALTAVSVTALTIYDMCKAVDHGMVIEDITLMSKTKLTADD